MIASFDGIALRQLKTRRLRALLTAFGIVLGVGMVFGVLLLVGTIRHTFDDLISSAWGKTDVVVVPKNSGVIPQGTLTRVRAVDGVKSAGPMVGGVFTRLDSKGKALTGAQGRMLVAGYEPSAPVYDFRYLSGRAVRTGPEVVIEKNWAADKGIGLGEYIPVTTPTGRARLHVVGIFQFSSGLSFGGQGLAGMPLEEARLLTNTPVGYHQIAIQAADRSQVDELRKRVAAAAPGTDAKTPSGLADDIGEQLQGLNVVLYFFSGVALFVGGFLILNSFNMTVLQRIREIGMLRTLGASRAMVARSVLVEALAIGVAGSVLGLALGALLSLGLIALMQSLGIPVGNLHFALGPAIVAVIVGLVTTAAGALYPARRAARVPPIQAAQGTITARKPARLRRALIGFALLAPGAIFGGSYWLGGSAGSGALAAVAGIGGTMLMFVGMAVAAPVVIMPIVQALAVPMRRLSPIGGRLAADATQSNPARTAATAVALTIGLSVIVVNSAMSASFLGTISDQIDQTYARDFTIAPIGSTLETAGGQSLAPQVAKHIAGLPGSEVVTPVRATFLKLPKAHMSRPGAVLGIDPVQFPKVDLSPIEGATREAAYEGVARGGVIVTKDYQTAADLHVGDTLPLVGPGGTHEAPVVGVQGTTSDSGTGMRMSLATLASVYGVREDSQVLVKAREGVDKAALGRQINSFLEKRYPNLEASSTAEIKDRIETQVNQQFNLFNAILVIAVIVSLLGVVNTLAMSVIERTRDIGVLRALGSSRAQVRHAMVDESLLITVAGAAAGVGFGLLIAYFWVQGLGSLVPGITFHFPVQATVAVFVASVVLGVLASVLPARRAARLDPVQALGYE
jgi:putative ABC transport system permease protein